MCELFIEWWRSLGWGWQVIVGVIAYCIIVGVPATLLNRIDDSW